jgi:hypothetical protein
MLTSSKAVIRRKSQRGRKGRAGDIRRQPKRNRSSANWMIGTTGKARVRLQKGAPGRAGGSPTIATDVLFLPPSRKVTRTAAKPNGDDRKLPWVGITFRITNPRAPVRQDPFSDRPAGSLCCTLLRSIFPNATQDSSEWARSFSCDGGIRSQRARVSSVRRCRTSALRLVSSVLHTPLRATRSDASVPFSSEGLGRGFDGSGTGSPRTALLIDHIRSGIRLHLSATRSTRREFNLIAS